jgi:hypothetical protein
MPVMAAGLLVKRVAIGVSRRLEDCPEQTVRIA